MDVPQLLGLKDVDLFVCATGSTARMPAFEFAEATIPVETYRNFRVGQGAGEEIGIIVQDDHMAPLAVANRLASDGHRVTLIYSTIGPAQLVGKYISGAIFAELDRLGVEIMTMLQAVGCRGNVLLLENVYSGIRRQLQFDRLIIACGGQADDKLFHELRAAGREAHIMGDAYAPRRLVFATRQALALVEELSRAAVPSSRTDIPVNELARARG